MGEGNFEFKTYPNRETRLDDLPDRERRMVGSWCYLDRFGSPAFRDGIPMNVPPHPHIGLQNVSWLVEREVPHHDSPGNEVLVKPGGVNIITAGYGISYSEKTPIFHRFSGRMISDLLQRCPLSEPSTYFK